MDSKWKERLVGPIVSLPTFNDDKYNLLLERQRKHVRWLILSDAIVISGRGEPYS